MPLQGRGPSRARSCHRPVGTPGTHGSNRDAAARYSCDSASGSRCAGPLPRARGRHRAHPTPGRDPGQVPKDAWPGQTSDQRTLLVGRFSLYNDSPDQASLHFTVVSTVRPESEAVRTLSMMSIQAPEGSNPPAPPRVVMFEQVEVDGQQLPVLTEMPVGHMPPGT